MNEAIQRFVDELSADPAVRGIILFGSHARGNARADSDADLMILGERDQFEMGFAERDGHGASFKDQLALARRMLPLIYDEAST